MELDSFKTSLIHINDIKDTNPIEISEYAKENKIDKEPEFSWWLLSSLKFRKVMVCKEAMIVRMNTKFGIDIPDTYDEVIELDRINSNTYCQDAIKKEMKKSEVAYKFIDNGSKVHV